MQIYSRAMFVLNLQQKRQWPQAATICGTKKENDDEKNNTTGPYRMFAFYNDSLRRHTQSRTV